MAGMYNSLGQILAEGGEIPIGIAIGLGYGKQKIGKLIDRKFGAMVGGDMQKLVDIAEAGAEAGRILTGLGLQGPIDLSSIPIQSLWDEIFHRGNRGIVVVESTPAEGGPRVQTRLWMPDFEGIEEMMADLLEILRKWHRDSPKAFGAVLHEYFPDFDIQILFAERRF